MNRGAPFVWPLSSSTINTEPCDASPQSKRCEIKPGDAASVYTHTHTHRERGSSGINQVIKQEWLEIKARQEQETTSYPSADIKWIRTPVPAELPLQTWMRCTTTTTSILKTAAWTRCPPRRASCSRRWRASTCPKCPPAASTSSRSRCASRMSSSCAWRSTAESANACTTWTWRWTGSARSCRTRTGRRCASSPRSLRFCWPETTSLCWIARWTRWSGWWARSTADTTRRFTAGRWATAARAWRRTRCILSSGARWPPRPPRRFPARYRDLPPSGRRTLWWRAAPRLRCSSGARSSTGRACRAPARFARCHHLPTCPSPPRDWRGFPRGARTRWSERRTDWTLHDLFVCLFVWFSPYEFATSSL